MVESVNDNRLDNFSRNAEVRDMQLNSHVFCRARWRGGFYKINFTID